MIEVIEINYDRKLHAFVLNGKGWRRIATIELMERALADRSSFVNQILCEGSDV